MFTKKRCMMMLLLICAVFLLTSCSQTPIKIGLIADLTGRASEIGISGRNGAEIAVEEINEQGGIKGRRINLIVKDDKGFPDEAVKVDQELLEEDILLSIGHFTSGTGIAGIKVFAEAGKLMVSPTMSSESLTGIDDCFLRVIDSNKKQGEILADTAINISKNKKIAVVYEKNNAPYTEEVCKYFIQRFEGMGGNIVMYDSFVSSPNVDFDTIVNEICASGADGVLIVAGGLDLAVITQKVKKYNSNIDIYSGAWAMTGDLIKSGGKAVEGLFLPGIYDKNNKNLKCIEFRNKYLAKYGEEPTFASIYSYETVYMIFEALKECNKKYDTLSIKNNIIKLGTFKGIYNDFQIDKNGDTDRGYYLFQVKNAEFVRVN